MKQKRWLPFILSAAMMTALFSPAVAYAGESIPSSEIQEEASVSVALWDDEEFLDTNTADLKENEELFAEYVDRLFFDRYSVSIYANLASSGLTGVDLHAYNALKERIQAIASGEEESAVIALSMEDLGIDKTIWTADELGVDAIVEDGQISSEAIDNLLAIVRPNLKRLMNYLLADCPMELYWFDKTKGIRSSGPGIIASTKELKVTEGITYYFSVAEEYEDPDAEEPGYTVNRSMVQTAQAAVETAKEIVETYEDFSDYEKLMAYRREICDLVSYNEDATDDSMPYGNPWQLIWVFDEDETTNVVCEGYAKAFQYLCDLSHFDSPSIICYTVNGIISGEGSRGGHMWNVVTMGNQKNYIVDVSNCDEGSIGADDRLFLSGASGNISDGYTSTIGVQYTYDDEMVNMYGDRLQIAQTDYALEKEEVHTFSDWVTVTEASCIKNGRRERKCIACGYTESEEMAAAGHEYGEWNTVAEPGCTEKGQSERVCKICGDTQDKELAATGHVLVKRAESGSKGYYQCEHCGKLFADEKGDQEITSQHGTIEESEHTYTEWRIVTEPSCTESGIRERICTVCGAAERQELAATGHDWQDGYTIDREPACTTTGIRSIHCKVCNEVKDQEEIPVTSHIFQKETKEATETEDGYTADVCTKCGQKKDTVILYKISTISLEKSKYVYTGKAFTPAVTVTDRNGTTISPDHYKVSYKKNTSVGTASATIVFSGSYKGTVTRTFQIIPKTVKISKLTAISKGFKVNWKKQTSQTTGYQIQYSTSSKFKNGRTVPIKKNRTTSKSVKKLKAKKKYYVRIRAYKTVNGKKIFSNWSAVKKVVTKK